MRSLPGRTARAGAALFVGAVAALVNGVVAVLVLLSLPIPRVRRSLRDRGVSWDAAGAATVWLAQRQAARWEAVSGRPATPAATAPGPGRAVRYLVGRVAPGLLGGVVLALVATGLVVGTTMLWSFTTRTDWVLDPAPAHVISTRILLYNALAGLVLLYLAVSATVGIAHWEQALIRRLYAVSREDLLTRRVDALAESRAAVVVAVDDERRRIERDLHDGVQQRVVALGVLLGRARRHPEQAQDLIARAHDESQEILTELRDVSWRVYPANLDSAGLAEALESIAERAPLPTRIRCDLPEEPPPSIRTAAWFVVCEAVTNAAKHSGAAAVDATVERAGATLRVTVCDDGRGGADPGGSGLSGLSRRVAAADGELTVTSPPGGPTRIVAELPCG